MSSMLVKVRPPSISVRITPEKTRNKPADKPLPYQGTILTTMLNLLLLKC